MRRGNFLSNLMEDAREHGNSIYEELQGGSVIRSSIADWNEIAVATIKNVKDDADEIAAWISPTIDATPGVHTLEDTIDGILFDPQSDFAPLELIAMGAASTSKAAARGVQQAARKIGWKVDDLIKGRRAGVPDEVLDVVKPAKRKVQSTIEGMAHDQGGASIEAMTREAGGTRFFRVDGAGKARPILQGGEDAAITAAGKTQDAVVRVLPNGEQVVESAGRVSKLQSDAIFKLKPGRARDITQPKTTVLDLGKKAVDEDDFLSEMGVVRGAGPPRRVK